MIMFPVVFESSRPGRLSFETTETADSSRALSGARATRAANLLGILRPSRWFFVFFARRSSRTRLGREAAISSEELLNFRST